MALDLRVYVDVDAVDVGAAVNCQMPNVTCNATCPMSKWESKLKSRSICVNVCVSALVCVSVSAWPRMCVFFVHVCVSVCVCAPASHSLTTRPFLFTH